MKNKLNYTKYDIEKWLYVNHRKFRPGETTKDYADNAVRYHNSKECRVRCKCINENNEYVSPRLSRLDQKLFKKVIVNILDYLWWQNTYIGALSPEEFEVVAKQTNYKLNAFTRIEFHIK